MRATAALLCCFLTWPAVLPAAVAQAAPGRPAGGECGDWRECRQLALDARERGELETFHDLAWRTVQKGPPRDPDLMYLLARAQGLSGRPHDALVMLRRLAEMGVATGAADEPDLARTRELPGWPELDALVERVRGEGAAKAAAAAPEVPRARPAADAVPSVTASAAAAAIAPKPAAGAAVSLIPVEEAVSFPVRSFTAGGLAYDAVSQRFVVGDLLGRKLFVVGEGSDHAVDMVRAESAGFDEILALEIDTRRGDLWVASGTTGGGAGAIHKLQLVSGRPLATVAAPEALGPVQIVDLAVSGGGVVMALEQVSRQVLVLRPKSPQLEVAGRLDVEAPVSLAAANDEGTVYVAHREGISSLDLRTRRLAAVASPRGFDLSGFERIRWHRGGLVGVQAAADGSRRVVRLDLNPAGRAVTAATVLGAAIPAATGPTFATVSGDELSYLTLDAVAGGGAGQLSVQRLRLRDP